MRNINRTRRLSMLSQVVSERLRVHIRENLGAAYSPFAYHQASRVYKEYGMMQIVVPVDPDEALSVLAEVRKLVETLVRQGVNQDELQRVLKPTLNGIKDMRRQNRYWLDTVLTRSRYHPEQIDWSRTIVGDYGAITAEELSELAVKYLDNDKAAAIIALPNETQ
jgi:zinc protease